MKKEENFGREKVPVRKEETSAQKETQMNKAETSCKGGGLP